jgi:hypothetical protein
MIFSQKIQIRNSLRLVSTLGILIAGVTLFNNGADAYICNCTCNHATGPVHNAGNMKPSNCPVTCQSLGYDYSTCKRI